MKKMIFALVMMLTATLSASAMSYERARNEALFLTDKMAYELNLTDAQYEAAYEINLDYLMGVATYDDVYGPYWERRNMDMSYILYQWQWDAFCAASYFFRPLYWSAGHWHFAIYSRYTVRDYFYFGRPHFYATYRGGHAWHVNGGRSWYHGRADHFRPAIAHNREHFGMRSKWDRGDFRGHSHSNRSMNEGRSSFRGSSSTRVTAGRNENNGSFGRSHSDNRNFGNTDRGTTRNFGNSGSGMNRNLGTGDRPTTTTTAPQPRTNTTTTTPSAPTRSFGNSSRSVGSSNLNRGNSGVGSSNLGNRSAGSTSRPSMSTSRPSTSSSSSRPSMSSSRSASSSTRSSNLGGSSRSSSSHGHFGGRR